MWSEKLKLNYEVLDSGEVRFEDGVTYAKYEMRHLKGGSDELFQKIHQLKKSLGGIVIGSRN